MLALVERPALSPDQAAELLGCTRQHIYNLIDRGELRRFKVGRLARIPTTDVLALVGIHSSGGDHAGPADV